MSLRSPPSHTTGRAVPHPAVQLKLWSRCWIPTSETSPLAVKYLAGNAWFMWDAPAFHHGPLPLLALWRARSASSPKARSLLDLVARVQILDSTG